MTTGDPCLEVHARPSLAVLHLIAQIIVEKDLHVVLIGRLEVKAPHDDEPTVKAHISQ
jgi:hypothetical protein